ncbi:hypothetical protein PM082_016751 [Marasmius tenuissimus]|nr:hypothetical protein PM082_016751 [Marasmius tenuissimus]
MFNSAISPLIKGGSFNIVHGNQSTNYYLNSQSNERSIIRLRPGEEWKEILYQEYERIPMGRIKLLKTLCHEPAATPRRRRIMMSSGEEGRSEAERIVEIASIVDGRDESLPLLAVRYTGRDAKELFKTDCIQFSEQRATNIVQLRAFNDSNIPMILFHEELVSVRQFLEYNLYSVQAQCYLHFQTGWGSLLDGSSDRLRSWVLSTSKRDDLTHLLWFRPHTGVLCFGPPGPLLEFNHIVRPFVRLERFHVEHPIPVYERLDLPPLPLNACNDTIFLDYLMHNVPEQFVVTVVSAVISHRVNGPAYRRRRFWKEHLTSGDLTFRSIFWGDNFARRVLKIPFHLWAGKATYSYAGPEDLQHLYDDMENGGLRRVCTRSLGTAGFVFREDRGALYSSREEEWLTQAGWIFGCLGIPRSEWPSSCIITGFTLDLTPNIQTPSFELEDWNEPLSPPCYLFVPPYPRLPNNVPDIGTWLHGQNLYYYSYDPEGGSAIDEEERISLRLPSFTSEIYTNYARWDANAYTFMEQWQKAKGFDYTTTDYAKSLGFPILEVIPQDECRFENLMGFYCEDEDSSEVLGADFMDVDSELENTRDDRDTISSSDIDMDTED